MSTTATALPLSEDLAAIVHAAADHYRRTRSSLSSMQSPRRCAASNRVRALCIGSRASFSASFSIRLRRPIAAPGSVDPPMAYWVAYLQPGRIRLRSHPCVSAIARRTVRCSSTRAGHRSRCFTAYLLRPDPAAVVADRLRARHSPLVGNRGAPPDRVPDRGHRQHQIPRGPRRLTFICRVASPRRMFGAGDCCPRHPGPTIAGVAGLCVGL